MILNLRFQISSQDRVRARPPERVRFAKNCVEMGKTPRHNFLTDVLSSEREWEREGEKGGGGEYRKIEEGGGKEREEGGREGGRGGGNKHREKERE